MDVWEGMGVDVGVCVAVNVVGTGVCVAVAEGVNAAARGASVGAMRHPASDSIDNVHTIQPQYEHLGMDQLYTAIKTQ